MGNYDFDLATVPNTSPQTGGDPLNLQLLMDGAEKDLLNRNFAAIADAVNNGGSAAYAVKTVNQAVVDSTTLVADTALILPVAANSTYQVTLSWLLASGAGNADGMITIPSGATAYGSWVTANTNALVASAITVTAETAVFVTTTTGQLVQNFLVVTGSTAGNIGLQFALTTGTGTVTSTAGSWMLARKIA